MTGSRRSIGRRLLRFALFAVLGLVLLSILMVATLRFVDPWTSGMMLQARVNAWFDDDPAPFVLRQEWRDFERISPQLALAVVASEDQLFTVHRGFDFKQIQVALDAADRGRRLRGASTISQQVAKNVFLWNGRSWVRKGAEVWFTVLIETLWSKQRILEMYLNVAEFGPGIYGAEAAAQQFYKKPAARLSRPEAARLAAVLPNPARLRAGRPSAYVLRRQAAIERQMAALGGSAQLLAELAGEQRRPAD